VKSKKGYKRRANLLRKNLILSKTILTKTIGLSSKEFDEVVKLKLVQSSIRKMN
jgi:hypothetical protein